MQRIIPKLGDDPFIDVVDVLIALLTTEAHIIIRFSMYTAYPFRLWSLTRKYNPAGYVLDIQAFLEIPDEQLDVGYSLPLKQDALSQGSDADAGAFLRPRRIQEELEGLVESAEGNSLDVERKHT